VAQLHYTVDKMVSVLEAHAACEEMQWLGMKEWLEDKERKWDDHHQDEVLQGTAIRDMAVKILAEARAAEREPAPEVDSGLQESRYEVTMQ